MFPTCQPPEYLLGPRSVVIQQGHQSQPVPSSRLIRIFCHHPLKGCFRGSRIFFGNPSLAFKKLPSSSKPTASSTVTRASARRGFGCNFIEIFSGGILLFGLLGIGFPLSIEKFRCSVIFFSKSVFQSETAPFAPSVFDPATLSARRRFTGE